MRGRGARSARDQRTRRAGWHLWVDENALDALELLQSEPPLHRWTVRMPCAGVLST